MARPKVALIGDGEGDFAALRTHIASRILDKGFNVAEVDVRSVTFHLLNSQFCSNLRKPASIFQLELSCGWSFPMQSFARRSSRFTFACEATINFSQRNHVSLKLFD